MFAGAGLDIAGAITAIKTEPSLAAWFAARQPRPSVAEVHALVVAQGETQFANFLLAAACWLVMAYANSRAKGNAPRIVSAVLFALGVSSLRSSGAPRTTAVQALSVIICLVGAATVVLLFSDLFPRPSRGAPGITSGSGPLRVQRTNRLAIATLACGFVSLAFFPAGIAAIIMAPRAQRQIDRNGENGRDLAKVGLALGYGGIAMAVIGLALPLILLAVSPAVFGPAG